MKGLIVFSAVTITLLMLRCAALQRHPMRSLLGSALGGTAALALVALSSDWTGVLLPLNGFTLFAAVLLGVPGVTAMSVLNFLLL